MKMNELCEKLCKKFDTKESQIFLYYKGLKLDKSKS